jgi:hypothetical protein
MRKHFYILLFISTFVIFGVTCTASAIPMLQLYIEGGTYDEVDESWTIATADPFNIWVIGNVKKVGTIYDVKLAAAVPTSEIGGGGSITLTPINTTLIYDPSISPIPTATANFPSADGAIPLLGDGSPLPAHGVYGTGTSFFEWQLGNFTLTDSPIGDFVSSFPTSFPKKGQINAYTVTVSGFSHVHFDTYDHYFDEKVAAHYIFAPFSHDGSAVVPEPTSLILLGSGLLGLFGYRRRSRKS